MFVTFTKNKSASITRKTQDEAIRDIIRIVEEHSETIIIIAIDNLGKEPILVELAKRFDVPVGLYTLNSRL